jgi:2-oxoglutarate/2-oxoacid ferredoxin oxidoreductase subunit alpha
MSPPSTRPAGPVPDTRRSLLEGTEAIAEAAISSGCRFFAGYPMSPFTELLEQMARKLPEHGGVCINAESEIEGINMALGAAAAGFRAATGSCGQGLALMQETVAELALHETPLVIFNLARTQQDYFQATRGGGWGDYRTLTYAPKDVPEAVEHTQLLFHLADVHRAPVILYADHFVAQTFAGVDTARREFGPAPPKPWALDGTLGGTGRARTTWSMAWGKDNVPGPGPEEQWRRVAAKFDAMRATESRWETSHVEDAEFLVTAFGTAGKFVEYVVEELRDAGQRVGYFRPITLWPFPEAALAEAARSVRAVLVFELNAGQMIDDVRLSVGRSTETRFIGDISVHPESGIRQGTLMDAPVIRERIERAMREIRSR